MSLFRRTISHGISRLSIFAFVLSAALLFAATSAVTQGETNSYIYPSATSTFHNTGHADGDGWAAIAGKDQQGFLVFGPYATNIPAGENVAEFRLMIDQCNGPNDRVLRLEVVSGQQTLAAQTIRRSDFLSDNAYQDFVLPFESQAGQVLEFRTWWYNSAYIKQASVTIEHGIMAVANAESAQRARYAERNNQRSQQLRNAWLQFPLATAITNQDGQPAFETVALTNSVTIGEKIYYGFKFKVPPRKDNEDFVWAFVEPDGMDSWYILPKTGSMTGFRDYFYHSKYDYPDADTLLPTTGRTLILQSLPGDELRDGETYLIWYVFHHKNPVDMSVKFTFAHRPDNSIDGVEKVLALDHHHPAEGPLSQPVVNPDNHHTYILLRPATWKKSEAEAVAMGGHLATVRNQAEEDWIFKTFGSYGDQQRLLWIGLSNRDKSDSFTWSSGESAPYTSWAKGHPGNPKRGEGYACILYPNHDQANKWYDWSDRVTDPIGLPVCGVVEIISP